MSLEIITTEDGSSSIINKNLNECYHSTSGAINESKHIFIENGLLACKKKVLNTLEVGFGTGLNALLTQIICDKNKTINNYHSIENLPILSKDYLALNYCKQLNIKDDNFIKMHNSSWGEKITISKYFSLLKINIDLQTFNPTTKYDLIYFDAFSPNKQPELWTYNIFKKLYKNLNNNGILITYCAKGAFKRTLKEIGFEVSSIDGPIGKREITQAKKR
mgnify:CR=1 FL=1